MAAHHLMVGAVVFANEETILISDGTLFLVPAGMRLTRSSRDATSWRTCRRSRGRRAERWSVCAPRAGAAESQEPVARGGGRHLVSCRRDGPADLGGRAGCRRVGLETSLRLGGPRPVGVARGDRQGSSGQFRSVCVREIAVLSIPTEHLRWWGAGMPPRERSAPSDFPGCRLAHGHPLPKVIVPLMHPAATVQAVQSVLSF